MYRIAPLTYLIGGMAIAGLANSELECSPIELLHLNPPPARSCGEHMTPYISFFGGKILDPTAVRNCQFCPLFDTNAFLQSIGIDFNDRWRDLGLQFAYIGFNIGMTFFLFWLARVPKKVRKQDGIARRNKLHKREKI